MDVVCKYIKNIDYLLFVKINPAFKNKIIKNIFFEKSVDFADNHSVVSIISPTKDLPATRFLT